MVGAGSSRRRGSFGPYGREHTAFDMPGGLFNRGDVYEE